MPQKNLQRKQKAKAMEQGGGGRGGAGGDGGDKNQQQQLPPPQEMMQQGEAAQVEVQAEVQPEAQDQPKPQPPPRLPQQPVQCPRCDSLNTKFCYYNNYSMSQPRYFCKTCRRYWTHGGTLRNVPVGGGCRKGKRGTGAKNSPSSSSENSASSSRSNQQQPQPPSQDQLLVVQAQPPNLTPMVGARDPPPSLGVVPSVTPFFQGGLGGYLPSLGVGGIHHSLSLNPSHPIDQALMNAVGLGDVGVGGSNLGVVSSFNVANSPGPLRPSQYFQLGGGERDVGPLYPPAEQQSLIPSTMAANSSAAAVAAHRDWTHRLTTNAANNVRATDGSMWSTVSTTNVSGNSQRNVAAVTGSSSSSSSSSSSALMMPNQWPNVPGFGPPPSSF